MDLKALTSHLDGQPVTNGWDAVCAINVANMNQLFLRWYLSNGPTNPDTPVQFIFQAESSYYLLDAMLGPPEIGFHVGQNSQQGEVTMIVASGVLLEFDPARSTVQNALVLQPDVARISGVVDLAKTEGTAALGDVVLRLGTGAYVPSIAGIETTSLQATALGDAFKTYFATRDVVFKLGGVTTAQVPASLQPRSFEFVVQPNPDRLGDGCVLLLIQTNGSPGSVGELASYPIPDGSTAALYVSNQVLFNQLFPSQLTDPKIHVTFTGHRAGSGYETRVSSGSLNLGVLSFEDAPGSPYSSNGKFEHFYSTSHEKADVAISFTGLALAPRGGHLASTYDRSWTQGWAYINQSGLGPSYPGDSYETANTTLSFNSTAPVTVKQPSICVVTFPWSNGPKSASELNKNLLGGFGQVDPSHLIVDDVASKLKPVFEGMTVASVDTFALQNLLFYPNQSLNLPGGALPSDLLLAGSVVPMLSIAPANIAVAPGGSAVQFTATMNGKMPSDLVWEIIPRIGTIDANGRYTPPRALPEPRVVTVTATNGNDSGSALILLYQPQPAAGLTVGPSTLILTDGQVFDYTVTDSNGNPASVTWTLSPAGPGSGTIEQVFGTWQYTAPATVPEPVTVTLTATSTTNASEYGTATVALVPTATVAITPASSAVSAGHSVNLAASVSSSLPEIRWLVYPSGAGTITATSPGLSATYTAPSSASESTTVQIVAYGVGSGASAVGIGIATITVTPA